MSAYQKIKEDFLKRIEEHPKLSQHKGEIFTAFSFGEEKHRGKNRKHSNEPYFIHPTSVASSLLSEQDVEKDFIIAASKRGPSVAWYRRNIINGWTKYIISCINGFI